ncbi:hypothetical protein V490_09313 [Pseudogymnoascus sp. VKM F-3557]|nr:hypothetical protein V490_09313 [Pseudogymnoascus sp. VKM F-3557]
MDADNSEMRRALRELPQAKNRNTRSIAPPPPPPALSFHSPPLPPTKRRRLVQKKLIDFGSSTSTNDDVAEDCPTPVHASSGAQDEAEDESQPTPSDTPTNPSQAADVATEGNEADILAILDEDEVAFGDAIWDDGDEDFIPSPDNDEGVSKGLEANSNISLSSNNIVSSGGVRLSHVRLTQQPHNPPRPLNLPATTLNAQMNRNKKRRRRRNNETRREAMRAKILKRPRAGHTQTHTRAYAYPQAPDKRVTPRFREAKKKIAEKQSGVGAAAKALEEAEKEGISPRNGSL